MRTTICVAASLCFLGAASSIHGGRSQAASGKGTVAATMADLAVGMHLGNDDDHQHDPRAADQDIDDYAGVDDGVDFQNHASNGSNKNDGASSDSESTSADESGTMYKYYSSYDTDKGVCLDGTTPVFWMREAVSSKSSNKWLIHLKVTNNRTLVLPPPRQHFYDHSNKLTINSILTNLRPLKGWRLVCN